MDRNRDGGGHDLLLLHQPLPSAFDRTLDAYRALETLLVNGRVRAIGVSNFMVVHLERLLGEASVVPAVNQIEVHPYFQQRGLQRLHAEHGILTQAWSPIGGITSYRDAERSTFDDPTMRKIGRVHGGRDRIASRASMERRIAALRSAGTEVEYHVYPGLGHGFGAGTGTEAEGWIGAAVAFWARQIRASR